MMFFRICVYHLWYFHLKQHCYFGSNFRFFFLHLLPFFASLALSCPILSHKDLVFTQFLVRFKPHLPLFSPFSAIFVQNRNNLGPFWAHFEPFCAIFEAFSSNFLVGSTFFGPIKVNFRPISKYRDTPNTFSVLTIFETPFFAIFPNFAVFCKKKEQKKT